MLCSRPSRTATGSGSSPRTTIWKRFGFYQRRGFRLVTIRPGAVDESRARLKPQIGAVGEFGIPLRDELELELRFEPASADEK